MIETPCLPSAKPGEPACPHCAYSLGSTPFVNDRTTCPECGWQVHRTSARGERKLRNLYAGAVLPTLLLALASSATVGTTMDSLTGSLAILALLTATALPICLWVYFKPSREEAAGGLHVFRRSRLRRFVIVALLINGFIVFVLAVFLLRVLASQLSGIPG